MRCFTFCTAEKYNLKKLVSEKKREEILYTFPEVVCLQIEAGLYFFFEFGSFVFWESQTQNSLADTLSQITSYSLFPLKQNCQDHFSFAYGQTTHIQNDCIILKDKDPLLKLTISYALSQSSKMDYLEEEVERILKSSLFIPRDLKKRGRFSFSRKKILQQMGEIFLAKSSFHLYADHADTSEFFWEKPELEPIYTMVCEYADLPSRNSVLHKKLEVIKELFQMLGEEMNHLRSLHLEWIIIFLIAMEIFLSLWKEWM